MVNWWLILLIILIPIIAVGCVVYIIFYFQSEEDRKANLLAKGVFGFGMTLALGSVLLLPFDVANSPDPVSSAKYYKTLNTDIMWEIVLWTMVIMGLAVCPFFLSFYEAYDPDRPRTQKQVTHGTIVALIVTTVFGVITLICYFKAGEAIVPFQSYGATAQLVAVDGGAVTFVSSFSNEKLTLDVTFTTYCIGMACFAGWILFFIYGGVGMVAFPIRTIRDFKMRTKAISATTFNQEMNVVLAKAETLLELSLSLQKESRGRMSRATKNKINIIRNEVYYLEAVQDNLIWAFTEAGGSPFLVYGKLALGIVGAVITILWCLQIFIYNTFGDDPFLNTMLIGLNNVFGLFGVVAYGILTFYLMWATFQGQIALGLRLVFFQIHPMKYRDTPINSLLFNVTLQLMIAFAVICFASLSFQDYAANASITGLMNIYVLRLKGIGTIIRWMQFLFLGVSLLSIIWLALCPKKKHKRDLTKLRLDDLDH